MTTAGRPQRPPSQCQRDGIYNQPRSVEMAKVWLIHQELHRKMDEEHPSLSILECREAFPDWKGLGVVSLTSNDNRNENRSQ